MLGIHYVSHTHKEFYKKDTLLFYRLENWGVAMALSVCLFLFSASTLLALFFCETFNIGTTKLDKLVKVIQLLKKKKRQSGLNQGESHS